MENMPENKATSAPVVSGGTTTFYWGEWCGEEHPHWSHIYIGPGGLYVQCPGTTTFYWGDVRPLSAHASSFGALVPSVKWCGEEHPHWQHPYVAPDGYYAQCPGSAPGGESAGVPV